MAMVCVCVCVTHNFLHEFQLNNYLGRASRCERSVLSCIDIHRIRTDARFVFVALQGPLQLEQQRQPTAALAAAGASAVAASIL